MEWALAGDAPSDAVFGIFGTAAEIGDTRAAARVRRFLTVDPRGTEWLQGILGSPEEWRRVAAVSGAEGLLRELMLRLLVSGGDVRAAGAREEAGAASAEEEELEVGGKKRKRAGGGGERQGSPEVIMAGAVGGGD